MPEFNKSKVDSAELTAAKGVEVDDSDAEVLAKAIDLAFDYRGDVTITRRSDNASIEGYIFDRRRRDAPDQSRLRIIPKGSDERVTVCYSDIAKLSFTGMDTAAGRSFETWMRKYVEKKLTGQEASIHSEIRDDG